MPSQGHCRNVLSWFLHTPTLSPLRRREGKPERDHYQRRRSKVYGAGKYFRNSSPSRLNERQIRTSQGPAPTNSLAGACCIRMTTSTGWQWRRVSRLWWPHACSGGLGTCWSGPEKSNGEQGMRGTWPRGRFSGLLLMDLSRKARKWGEGKPHFPKTRGKSLTLPVSFHSLSIGEAGFSALGLAQIPFTCLLWSMSLGRTNTRICKALP